MSDYLKGRDKSMADIARVLHDSIQSQAALAHRHANELAAHIIATLREEVRIGYRQGFIDAVDLAYRDGLAKTRVAAAAMRKHQPRSRHRKNEKPPDGRPPGGVTHLRPVS